MRLGQNEHGWGLIIRKEIREVRVCPWANVLQVQ